MQMYTTAYLITLYLKHEFYKEDILATVIWRVRILGTNILSKKYLFL